MLYFGKYESGQNYDQGLSYGDGYHAMGYFQFDNRYGLGEFLKNVYYYNTDTYSALAVIGEKYGWDVSGTTYADGKLTDLGNDLNTAWHAAYAANPTEFSELQNDWAYENYYDGNTGARRSLIALGIDIDSRSDYVKGLCWGLCNLFGGGRGYSYVEKGYYYGWNWFLKNSGVDNSMDDQTFVTTLCNFVINNVSTRYPSQSAYWQGWENRYTSELDTCLSYGYTDADTYASSVSSSVLSPGIYEIAASTDSTQVLDVPGASTDQGTQVQMFESNDTDAQGWIVTVGTDGYCTITNKNSGLVLDVSGGVASRGTAVDQWESNDTRAQKWVAVQNSDGTVTFHSALGKDLVLDLPSGNTSNGTTLQIWSSNGASAQKFTCNNLVLKKASDNIDGSVLSEGIYTVASSNSLSAVLDVTSGQTSDGANVQLWSTNSTGAQKWQVSIDSEGFVTLENLRSGKVLDVTNGNASAGTNVQQWTSNGTSAQKWVAIKNSDGTITLWSKLGANLVLDVAGGTTNNGSNVQIYSYNSSGAQKYSFTKTSGANDDSINNMTNASVSEGTYLISSLLGNNEVLDVPGGSLSSATNMQIYTSNETAAQRWYIRSTSNGYTLQNVESGLYLTEVNGTAVQTNNAGTASQWLIMNGSGSATNAVLVNVATNKVLDVKGGQSSSGTQVWTYSFNGTTAQKWSLSAESILSTGTYEFVSDLSKDKCLDVAGGTKQNGGKVQIYTINGTVAQKWKVSSTSSGYYTITCVGSGKVLDVDGGSSLSGTTVWQYSSNGTKAQRWKFVMSSKGLQIVSALGTVLDVAGGATSNGTKVWSYSTNGTSAQIWHPFTVSASS
jgi:5-hydroxyisourate hydrolase-like protein (transthyretin family)